MSSPKLSGSGSIQSHLSTANQRIKSSTSAEGGMNKKSIDSEALPSPCSTASPVPHFRPQFLHIAKLHVILFRSGFSDTLQSTSVHGCFYHWSIICIKAIIIFYCCFSLVYAPFIVYIRVFGKERPEKGGMGNALLSDNSKLSRSIFYQPELHTLRPAVVSGILTNQSITVCMWADENELEADLSSLVQWGIQWNGPISLLVTTRLSRNEFPTSTLIESLNRLKIQRGLAFLSVHLLHINTGHALYSSNALLNTARLLSSTSHVLLVPGGHSFVPSNRFRDDIMMWSNASFSTPSVLVNSTSLKYPFPRLTPLLIPRDFDLWCPERFLYLTDRSSTWDECLWHFWLRTEGKFDGIRSAIPSQILDEDLTPSDAEVCDTA
ncbi:hypothetical protein Moror_6371 [Moniliophthora roreri MCA 2997]|uniref:Uncharacterized protein n=2 Tax=Moniliophthora roreri TaxID=221103 RepID=V2XXB3_MONRO|nr:hypothetical protein Moror_6371 [Moniliophthora roreri MCA 2997]